MYSSFCFLHPKPSIHLQVKNWAAKGSNNFSCHLLDVNEARHYFSQAFKTLTVFFCFLICIMFLENNQCQQIQDVVFPPANNSKMSIRLAILLQCLTLLIVQLNLNSACE